MGELDEKQKTLVKGTTWNLLGSFGLKFISFVYVVIVARLVEQGELGSFYLALSIVGIVVLFSDLGLANTLTRYIPYYYGKNEKNKISLLLYLSYGVSTFISFLLAFVVFLFSSTFGEIFQDPLLVVPLQLLTIYIVIDTLFKLNRSLLVGRKKIFENNLTNLIQNGTKLLLTLFLFFLIGQNILSLTFAFIASFIIAFVATLCYVRNELKDLDAAPNFNESSKVLYEILPFGLTISLILAFRTFVNYTDKLMIGYFLPADISSSMVAVYTIATSLALLATIFSSAVGNIFLPVISELYGAKKKKEMHEIAATSVKWIIFLVTPLSLVFIVFPEDLLQMFYGTAYVTGAATLAIFTIGMFIRALSFIHGSLLVAHRFVKIELKIAASAAVVNVVLNLFLIPLYGIEGAALASAVSLLLVAILIIHYSKKLTGFGFPKSALRPIIATALVLAVLFVSKGFISGIIDSVPQPSFFGEETINLVAQKLIKLFVLGLLFLLTCALYFLALLGLKAFGKDDLAFMSTTLKKAKVPESWVLMAERLISGDDDST